MAVASPVADAGTYTVTSTTDSGPGSLRQAIIDANVSAGADAINFSSGLAGQTIELSSFADDMFGPSALLVTSDISIDGGANGITISRNAAAAPHRLRLFYVAQGGNLTLSRITLRDGLAQGTQGVNAGGGGAGLGGAIVNAGILTLQSCTLHGNLAKGADSSSGNVGIGMGGGLGRVGPPGSFGVGAPTEGGLAARTGGFGGGGGAGFALSGGAGGFGGGGAWGTDFSGTPGLGATWATVSYARTGAAGAGMGGAIFNYGGTVNLSNSTLAENAAIGGMLTVDDYYYPYSYRANGLGGAIFNLNGSIVALNTTIARNQASQPFNAVGWNLPSGAIFNLGDNGIGTQDGPPLPSSPASVNLVNCLLAGSVDGGGIPIADFIGVTYDSGLKAGHAPGLISGGGSNNFIQNAASPFGGAYTSGDLFIGPLANNGGPTKTIAIPSSGPAFNTGSTAQAPAFDQRGVARPQGASSDIGAFEQGNILLPTTLSASTVPAIYGQFSGTITVTVDVNGSSPFQVAGSLNLSVAGGAPIPLTLAPGASQVTFQAPPLNAGSYPYTVTFTPNNYAEPAIAWLPSSTTGTLVVNKASTTISVTQSVAIYDGQPKQGTAAVRNSLGSTLANASISYSIWDGGQWVPVSTPTAIGLYNATASWTSTDANYNNPQAVDFTFEIRDPATVSLVVTTVVDEDDGSTNPALGTGTSLREAVAGASLVGGDLVVSFSPTLFDSGPRTIALNLGKISIANRTGKMTIAGPGANLLTINGSSNNSQRIFDSRDQSTEINGITFAQGSDVNGGGAIYAGGTVYINDCHFTLNGHGLSRGGAVLVAGASRIANCSFTGNYASSGGAIAVDEQLVLINCTFHGNTANGGNGEGGALYAGFSSAFIRVIHSTFAGNSAVARGGAMSVMTSRLSLMNSIVSGNLAAANPNLFFPFSLQFPSTNNLVDAAAADIFATGLPAINGGSTQTIALKPAGPAINNGSNQWSVNWTGVYNYTTDSIAADQRGAPRKLGGTVDIGAFELPDKPTLASPAVTELTATSATLAATVVAGQYSPVNERGFVFARTAENPNPQRGGPSVTEILVTGFTGSYSAQLPSLDQLTDYSFASFATNEAGITYSTVTTFNTGNVDTDGDSLTDSHEASLGSNPSIFDTDSDGFNDATEYLNDTNSSSPASIPSTSHIERVFGFGPARGLDLSGNFVYAFNVGPAGAAGQAGDANFTADNASGITVHAPNHPIAVWNNPDFGASAGDNTVETVYQSIRWADRYWSAPDKNLRVDLANLTVGRKYKLQLLFGEAGSTGRRFDVVVNGALVANDFAPSDAQGSAYMAKAGSAVVHEFTATSSTLNIVLDGTNVEAVANLNQDPYLNGATLEDITPPTALDTWRSLHGLAANGSQDLANPSGDGVANLLKFAFNLAASPGDLSHPNAVVLAENGSSGLPRISRDGSGRLVVEFVRRKVSSNSGIVYEVQTGEQLTGLFPLSLDSATITSIDADWERVRLADPAGTSKRFGRVKVTATP